MKLSAKLVAITCSGMLLSSSLFAAPKIIFKNMNAAKPMTLSNQSIPSAINQVIQGIENKDANLYEIVVHQFKDYYDLYLLSSKVWEMKKIRVELDAAGKVIRVFEPGVTTKVIQSSAKLEEDTCPDPTIQFLVISAYPKVGAVNDSIGIVSEAAKKKYKTMTILDEAADSATYKKWLSCPNLKGVYSIGHGSPEGIMVGNGEIINYNFFASASFINRYKEATVLINSCQVYNYPFGTEIMYGNALEESSFEMNPGPHAYEYIGGHTNLLMFSSERSSACFMAKAIDGAKMDYDTLKQCIGDQDLHYQNFGLSNPGQYFAT